MKSERISPFWVNGYQPFSALKDYIIRSGIKFINAYETIYTTRLHAAIIALLLKKEVYIFDNSYGKIKGAFSHSLLLNAPIHFIEKNNG